MASCQFKGDLGLVSGTLKKATVVTPEGVFINRLVAKVINGKQRIYLQQSTPRSTPITEKEMRQRRVFAAANAYWAIVKKSEYILGVWANNYKASPERKNYKTLAGYIKACAMRFYKEHPEKIDEVLDAKPDWEPRMLSE